MKNKPRPAHFYSRIIGLCMLVLAVCPFPVFAETGSGLDIQLIADQTTVSPGGEASLHLLVYNNGTQSISDVKITLLLPPDLEAGAVGKAEWKADLRELIWNLQTIPAGGTEVFHFNLKVGADVQAGTPFTITGTVQSLTGLSTKIAGVQLTTGTQIDQPFFQGYPDGKFHPESDLTRAEAAAVIARIKNLEMKPEPVNYSDVPTKHWAYPYIVKVTQEGYMKGSGGKFRPDEPITRAEMVVLILRLRGIHPIPEPSFGDLDGHWAKDAVGTAKSLHIVDGLTTIAFDPDRFLRRDEAAKLIDIGLSRGPLVDGETKVIQHFPDVSRSHWAFGWIEEASVVAHEGEYRIPGQESLIRYLPEQTEPL
jgi:hypothetical protein